MQREVERIRAENESLPRRRGYLFETALPKLTNLMALVAGVFGVYHFGIEGTGLDRGKVPPDRHLSDKAKWDYADGDLEDAAEKVAKILAKVPGHPEAHQLMAHIAQLRGDYPEAREHLRQALETSEDQEELTRWLAEIKRK